MSNPTNYVNFYYDPRRQGYDTSSWHTIHGAPLPNTGKLDLNNTAIIHYGDILRGDVAISLVIPSSPAGGDNRSFGLYSLNRGAYAIFNFSGTTFQAKTSDGTTTTSSAITWNSSWNSTSVEYRIKWEAGTARFYINGNQLAVISDISVTGDPLSIYIANENADTVKLSYINAKGIQSFYMNNDNDNASFEVDIGNAFDTISISETVSMLVTNLPINVSDSLNITDIMSNDLEVSFVNVNDTMNVSDVIVNLGKGFIAADNMNITDVPTITMALPGINVSDQLNTTESNTLVSL